MDFKTGPAILAIGTAVPPNRIDAAEYVKFISAVLSLSDEQKSLVERFVKGSEITQRHVVLDDFLRKPDERQFFGVGAIPSFPSTQTRNEIYKREAPGLALQAAQKALENWGGSVKDITHIIFVSCTGLVAPGIECFLMQNLGIPHTVSRTAVNFMGCFGALRALSLAQAFAVQDPKARILITCAELCSLHIQSELALDTIIGNVLFADGAAAMVVGAQPQNSERPLWHIIFSAAQIIACDDQAMRWDISDSGFVMRLRSDIPHHIGAKIHNFVESLTARFTEIGRCDWAIHPGGKSIIQAIERACSLSRDQTQNSWHILRNFGNMSSATLPFVLERLRNNIKNEFTVTLAFGPGLSVEGALLKNA